MLRASMLSVTGALAENALSWYAGAARDLPWRRPGAGPWAVLVSEVMLQQTPVARVLPVYAEWLRRWPSPDALAVEPAGEAIRQWGRLGYPRRALHLHAAAGAIVDRHDGRVPDSLADLLALPGVGDYTARAVATFAFGQRHAVVDTNVRRVLARALAGEAVGGATTTAADLRRAEAVLPADPATAGRAAVAIMELGALVCTARTPHCDRCPLAGCCVWLAAGRPAVALPARRRKPYAGTDREVRGRLLAALRSQAEPVQLSYLRLLWPDDRQLQRALAGLVADGLARRDGPDRLGLPH